MLGGVDGAGVAEGRPATTSELGVLGGHAVLGEDFELLRLPVAADLSELVERHWMVRWSLPPGRRATVTHLPHPCVNVVLDNGGIAVCGVGRERFSYPLAGSGQVYGIKFRPGGFAPFLRAPLCTITEQVRPLSEIWPAADVAAFTRELTRAGAGDLPELARIAERQLRAHWPAPDPEVPRVARIVAALLRDRTITRVEEVAARFGTSPRSLQRLFRRYVGVSPKWVLSRYRLHEAAARLAEEDGGDWAAVATELGYFDQPHFIRDFTRAVGMTPVAYAQACRSRRAPVAA
jgi:AraC-like DNA-binding protein